MYTHTLIMGGTGMLRAASVRLAAQSRRLTSVARTRRSLSALDAALPEGHAVHELLALDWNQPDAFVEGIARHIRETGAPDLVVAWIHDDHLAVRLASMLAVVPLRFFHVIGSASADPLEIAAQARSGLPQRSRATYHQVILGANRAGTRPRWLTDAEICEGVLAAIRAGHPQFIIGTLVGS